MDHYYDELQGIQSRLEFSRTMTTMALIGIGAALLISVGLALT